MQALAGEKGSRVSYETHEVSSYSKQGQERSRNSRKPRQPGTGINFVSYEKLRCEGVRLSMPERHESRPQKGLRSPGKESRLREVVGWPGFARVILRRGKKRKGIVYYQNSELGTH